MLQKASKSFATKRLSISLTNGFPTFAIYILLFHQLPVEAKCLRKFCYKKLALFPKKSFIGFTTKRLPCFATKSLKRFATTSLTSFATKSWTSFTTNNMTSLATKDWQILFEKAC